MRRWCFPPLSSARRLMPARRSLRALQLHARRGRRPDERDDVWHEAFAPVVIVDQCCFQLFYLALSPMPAQLGKFTARVREQRLLGVSDGPESIIRAPYGLI